ncbi:MAG TPA: hypothetical protein VID27_02975, partial [Blastocatellia bacterium]
FNQTSIPQLYSADTNSATGPQTWFLLPENTAKSPTQISVSDSWNLFTTGVYIFLDDPLASGNQSAFAQAAWLYLSNPSLKAVRFAWFANPNSPQSGLVGNTIPLFQPAGSNGYQTSRAASFDYQNISLIVGVNCAVTLNDDDSFQIAQADSTNTSIYLTASWGSENLFIVGSSIRLPLGGALSGCIQFPTEIGQTGGVSDLTLLDVGLRYFYPTPSSDDGDGFFLTSLRYPVFNESQPSFMLYGNLDPLSTDDSRSYFAFNASDSGLAPSTPAPLVSNYVSTLGNPFSLVPADRASAPTAFARLAFAINPASIPSGPQDPLYLVPKGDFQVQLPAAVAEDGNASPPQLRVMGGLSGVEYVALQEGAVNYLSFFDNNSAYAGGFTPGQPSTSVGDTPGAPTTSWAFLSVEQAALTYYAQPNQAVLYQPTGQASANFQPLFYLEVPSNQLPSAASTSNAFPLLPYAGVTSSDIFPPPTDETDVLSIFQQLETEIISPARRNQVITIATTPSPRPGPSSPIYGTTPQGLLAQFAGDYSEWTQLVLAQMPNQQFMLTDIENNSDLWNALQTNKLFLVISDPASIQSYLQTANSLISMGDPAWNFQLDPANWTKAGLAATRGTIMILKFHNKKIVDLAADTSAWVQAEKFNKSPQQESSIMGAIIAQAIDQFVNKGNQDFAQFYGAVTDENWNGILILNACSPLSALPPELAGLAAGIDPSLFFAHHIGINASVINTATTPISLQNSMMFGLINYQDESPLVSGGQDYLFRVTSLKVLFANSQVSSFSSQIELMINSMFGEAVTLEANASANIVEMFGVFQEQVLPDGTTVDSYLFQTAEGASIVLNMQSKVLNAIVIDKAQFITLTNDSTTSETDTRFVFWGVMDFVSLEGFDLFSFGREAGASEPAGLSFANLALDMSFSPSDASEQTFTFDASQMSFDMAGSQAREQSFFNHFPLTLVGLTQAKSGTSPTGLGYMSVQSPLNQSALNYPWFSLDFNLNLGTVGALAGEAGFIATLTAAWSPNPSDYSVFTGLSLPGSNGGKREISIEGVLKITFKTIEIIVDTSNENIAYILILYSIALGFLSISFPPTGQFNIVLFGNPDPQGDNTSLGWYAAYAKPQSNTQGQNQSLIPPTTTATT